MQVSLYHLQINVSSAAVSLPFYRDLLLYVGYRIIDKSSEHLGASNGGTDFWIIETEASFRANGYHRKNTGLNHLAFRVERREEVDRFVNEFLCPRGIVPLYDTPCHFPQYREGYYAVFFEDPDRLKLEVLHFPEPNPLTE